MSEARKFLKGILGFSFGPIISAIIGFLMVPITTRLIDPAEFGKGSFFLTLLNLFSMIILLGLDQSYVREFHETKNRKQLLFISLLPAVLITFIISIGLLIYWKQFSLFFFDTEAIAIVILFICTLFFNVFYRYSSLIIRMKEKAIAYSLMNILRKVFALTVLISWAVLVSNNLYSVILSTTVPLLLIFAIQFFIERSEWKFEVKSISIEEYARLLKFGLPLIVSSSLMWGLNSMDKIALKIWTDFNELGLYSNAFRITSLLTIIQAAFTTFWAPISYRWYAEKVDAERFNLVSNFMGLTLTSVFVLIITFKDLFRFIIDARYYDSLPMVPFLLFYPVMYTLSETTSMGIAFNRKTWLNILITGIAALVNLVGNWLLVPHLEGVGASISTGFSFIVFFWIRSLVSNNQIKLVSLKMHLILTLIMVGFSTMSFFNLKNDILLPTMFAIHLYCLISGFLLYKKQYRKKNI